MSASQTNRCGYTWPQNPNSGRSIRHQNCCYRRTISNSGRCAWHTDVAVSIDELKKVRAPIEIRNQNSPIGELLDGADLSNLDIHASIPLENVSLRDANLSEADLRFTNLSNTDLRGADLTETTLKETSFRKSDLRFATFSDSSQESFWSPLTGGDFTGADLREIEFPDNLRYVQFEKSFIFEHPIDFDPDLGVQEADDLIELNDYTEMMSEMESSDYFGPPTYEPGRLICMRYWPNITPSKVLKGMGWAADFSGKNLLSANLSGAHLWQADFSDAFLEDSDFSDAVLWMADLSNAELRNADLSNTDLRDADLTGADLRRTNISDVKINGGTECAQLYQHPKLSHDEWNSLARAYHDLKALFGENGLIGKARNYHAQQRRARGLEAKARDGWTSRVYLGSKISGILTGYGVRVQYILGWMILLFLFSTVWYIIAGVEDSVLRNFSFSVITFTTTPPTIPAGIMTQIVAMIETFFGTLLVVLLGYILGNREQF